MMTSIGSFSSLARFGQQKTIQQQQQPASALEVTYPLIGSRGRYTRAQLEEMLGSGGFKLVEGPQVQGESTIVAIRAK